MRNHLIHNDVLLNETDLSSVHRALLPDLSQPENMKTYSFNYSGQLLFFFKLISAHYSHSQILQPRSSGLIIGGLIQRFKLTHNFFYGTNFPSFLTSFFQ